MGKFYKRFLGFLFLLSGALIFMSIYTSILTTGLYYGDHNEAIKRIQTSMCIPGVYWSLFIIFYGNILINTPIIIYHLIKKHWKTAGIGFLVGSFSIISIFISWLIEPVLITEINQAMKVYLNHAPYYFDLLVFVLVITYIIIELILYKRNSRTKKEDINETGKLLTGS